MKFRLLFEKISERTVEDKIKYVRRELDSGLQQLEAELKKSIVSQ